MNQPDVVHFQRVSKEYRSGLLRRRVVHALRSVSFAVPAGSVFGLLGPNRAGKTTLVKILLSVARPTSGSIRRFGGGGRDRMALAKIGYLHESQAFPRYLTANGLLDFYGALSFVPASQRRQRIPRLLDQVGLADRAQEPIACFSKGMVQRLALAQALVNDPELLVLDEPTEGMDLVARRMLHDVIRQRQRQGKTALLVSHSLADVEELCDRAAVLRFGELAFCGPLEQLTGDDHADAHHSLQEALEPLYAGTSS